MTTVLSPSADSAIHLGWSLPELTVRTVVESYGHFAHGGDPDRAAEAWAEAGFDGPEVEQWLHARCFSPRAARDLLDAGVGADAAALITRKGGVDYADTVGFKVSVGDMEVGEARGAG